MLATAFFKLFTTTASSRYSEVISADFDHKRFDLPSAKAMLLQRDPTHSFSFNGGDVSLLSARASTPPGLSSLSILF